MKVSEKDKRALAILNRFTRSNMELLEAERRFAVLPDLLQHSSGEKLRKIFARRGVLEDKMIGENPAATNSRSVNAATNRRNIYLKAILHIAQYAKASITELESLAWRHEHPAT